jgi:predicted DNA-binding transcriptional regulator AlpA
VIARTEFKPKAAHALPVSLADVALIDALTCAAAGDMSVTWWHEEVRAGRAPAPVIRKPRCTRWRLSDVRAFWIASAEFATADTQASELVKARATKASAKAKANRAERSAA